MDKNEYVSVERYLRDKVYPRAAALSCLALSAGLGVDIGQEYGHDGKEVFDIRCAGETYIGDFAGAVRFMAAQIDRMAR